jgi:glucokinase
MPDQRELTSRQAAQAPFFLGVDVGGTNIKIGLVDDRGTSIADTSIATQEERGPGDAIDRVAEVARRLTADAGVEMEAVLGVGLAAPGTMDIPGGMLLQPHNLPHWWNFPIRDRLRDALGKPVAFANDAAAAAFGEYWVGSGAAYHSIVLLTLGTGVGGGIIIGDLSIDGENSHGAECGHIIIDSAPSARVCGCGKPGHLEAYASARGVVQRTQDLLKEGRASSLHQRLARGEELTPLMVAEEAERDDGLALEIVMQTAMYLGIGVVTLMHVIDPGAVIFGGAMTFGGSESDLGRRFLERIRQEIRLRAFPVLAERTDVHFATLGGDAGYIGVAGIVRSRLSGRDGI